MSRQAYNDAKEHPRVKVFEAFLENQKSHDYVCYTKFMPIQLTPFFATSSYLSKPVKDNEKKVCRMTKLQNLIHLANYLKPVSCQLLVGFGVNQSVKHFPGKKTVPPPV